MFKWLRGETKKIRKLEAIYIKNYCFFFQETLTLLFRMKEQEFLAE